MWQGNENTMRVRQRKVCLLGHFAVGKTSLIRRYVEGRFDEGYLSTIGVRVSRRVVERDDHALHLLLWDLAGSSARQLASSNYLRGLHGAIIVCDLTRAETIESLPRFVAVARDVRADASLVLVGNKLDLVEEREVSESRLRLAAARLDLPLILTSARTGENVTRLFATMADELDGQ